MKIFLILSLLAVSFSAAAKNFTCTSVDEKVKVEVTQVSEVSGIVNLLAPIKKKWDCDVYPFSNEGVTLKGFLCGELPDGLPEVLFTVDEATQKGMIEFSDLSVGDLNCKVR